MYNPDFQIVCNPSAPVLLGNPIGIPGGKTTLCLVVFVSVCIPETDAEQTTNKPESHIFLSIVPPCSDVRLLYLQHLLVPFHLLCWIVRFPAGDCGQQPLSCLKPRRYFTQDRIGNSQISECLSHSSPM